MPQAAATPAKSCAPGSTAAGVAVRGQGPGVHSEFVVGGGHRQHNVTSRKGPFEKTSGAASGAGLLRVEFGQSGLSPFDVPLHT